MKSRWTMGLLGTLAVVGCQNMGLDYAGPAEEAEVRPPFDLVASTTAPAAAAEERGLIMDGRMWVPSGRPLDRAEEGIRPVGSADGTTVYARGWDEAPYDELFAEGDEGWRSYRPVIGGGAAGGGPGAAGGAAAGGAAAGGAGHGAPAAGAPSGGH